MRKPQRDHRLVAEPARVLGRDDLRRDLLDHAELLQPGRAGQRQEKLPHAAARERLEQHVGIELTWEPGGADDVLGIRRRVRHGADCIAMDVPCEKLR